MKNHYDTSLYGIYIIIPICLYKGALDLAVDFFLSKAKNADLAALGQGFLTHEKEKSIEEYAALYRYIGIIWLF